MFLKIILIFQISLFAIKIYVIENFLVLKRSQWKQEMSLEAKKKVIVKFTCHIAKWKKLIWLECIIWFQLLHNIQGKEKIQR